jgi:hypothetical protein
MAPGGRLLFNIIADAIIISFAYEQVMPYLHLPNFSYLDFHFHFPRLPPMRWPELAGTTGSCAAAACPVIQVLSDQISAATIVRNDGPVGPVVFASAQEVGA